MADNRYVVVDYVASGYDEVQNTAWYIESDYVATGYVIQGITQSGEAAVSAAFSVTSTASRTRRGSSTAITQTILASIGIKCRIGSAVQTSVSNLTASNDRIRYASTTISSQFTFSATSLQIIQNSLTAFSAITLSATLTKLRSAQLSVDSQSTLTSETLRIRPADTQLTAFNTVVSAAGRIRPGVDITTLSATVSASAGKIFGAQAVSDPPAYEFNGNNVIISNTTNNGTNLPQGFGGGWIVAFSIKKNTAAEDGYIISSSTDINTFRVGVTDVGVYILATNSTPNLPGVRTINLGITNYTWDTKWHHILIKINQWATSIPGGNDLDNTSSADFYIDGDLIGSASESNANNLATQSGTADLIVADPYYLGENLQAAVRQLWIGETPASFTPADWYPDAYQDLGYNGTQGYTQTLPIPLIYNQFLDSDFRRNLHINATLTVNGGKIFGGIIQGQSPIPYPSLDWDTDFYTWIQSVGYVTQNPLGGNNGAKVISFWANATDGGGVVATSPAGIQITIYESTQFFEVELSDGLLSITGQTNTRSWYVPTTGWHHYLINMQYPGGEIRTYVDGVQATQTNNNTTPIVALIPNFLYIGDTFSGGIAQFWLGKTVINELTYWYNAGFVDMGSTGRVDNQTTGEGVPYQTVYYYDKLGFGATGSVIITNLSNRFYTSYDNQAITSHYPGPSRDWRADDIYRNIPTIIATLVANGYNIVLGVASLSAQSSLTAVLGYVKSSTATLNSAASLSATPYGFTKAIVSLSSQFSISADVDEISSGVVLSLANITLSASAGVIRSGVVITTLFAGVAVLATTNYMSFATIRAEANLSATPYNFTKASTAVTAVASIDAEGRLQSRVRANVQMQSVFALTASVLRIRQQSAALQSIASLTNGITRAVRNANISMQAFDTVLSAGKILEFLRENTVIVTEEQRLLRVSLESTLLLVEMANGVNSVMAENADIKVAEEQGVLLAQYNLPN